MSHYHLAIAYTWEYDQDFIDLIEKIFQQRGLKTYLIKPDNINDVTDLLVNRKLHFSFLLDRASDEDPNFLPVYQILQRRKCYIINPHHIVHESIDKASIHKKLKQKRFRLPKTFITPPFNQDFRAHIKEADLKFLKKPFIIKPSLFSGGGEGVIKNADSLQTIQLQRIDNPEEQFLIQEKIQPKIIHGRRAWFRVFWAFDTVIPTWWDDHTHIYSQVLQSEIQKYNLVPLRRLTRQLAELTHLDYFSTEIALTRDHKFYLIDYINDQCDMRLKSQHVDGVPDAVVTEFIERMYNKISTL